MFKSFLLIPRCVASQFLWSLFCTILLHMACVAAASASTPSHITGEKKLDAVVKSEKKVVKALKKVNIQRVHEMVLDIESQLMSARGDLDRAMLTGAWQDANIKRDGQRIIDRLESAKTLCTIARAFSSDYYSYPDNYVPASVNDALTKMYQQLRALRTEVKRINKNITQKG